MRRYKADFQIEYKSDTYSISSIVKDLEDKIKINFGYAGDEFPCIMLEYSKLDKVFSVSKLRAQPFGGWDKDEKIVCLTCQSLKSSKEPKGFTSEVPKGCLPSNGALDLLVMISLSFIHSYAGKCIVKINDDAKINNEYPLSWLKFFKDNRSTTYSKFGFIKRNPKDKDISFETYMEKMYRNLQDTVPRKIKNKLRYKFNKDMSYLTYIKYILDKRRYIDDFKLFKELNLDIRGEWYLSWDFYDKIKNKVNLSLTHFQDI